MRKSLCLQLGLVVVMAGLLPAAAQADSFTVVTFADPSQNSSAPLFFFDGVSLTGQWLVPGLLLETPGLPAANYPDAKFVMAPIPVGPGGVTGAGQINFYDAGGAPLMTISFDAGQLWVPFGFGMSDFSLQNVVFSGPIISFPLSSESAAFSFANQALVNNVFTATASFTSSAIPDPGTLALLALGGMTLARRRA